MNDQRRHDEDFVRNVLERTSGSPCERARTLLPDLMERSLQGLDRQLVQAHLEHCPDCRGLAVTLGWLSPLLPDMAVLDPGPDFTAAVIARTTGVLSPAEKMVRAGGTIGPAAMMDRLGRWWQEEILRPQFALQFAYVATVILVLLTALPISPFRGAPEKALQVVQARPGSIPVLASTLQWVDGQSEAVTGGIHRLVRSRFEALTFDLDRRGNRSSEARGQLSIHLQGAVAGARAGELGEAGYELMQAAVSVSKAWSTWWRGPPAPEDTNS